MTEQEKKPEKQRGERGIEGKPNGRTRRMKALREMSPADRKANRLRRRAAEKRPAPPKAAPAPPAPPPTKKPAPAPAPAKKK